MSLPRIFLTLCCIALFLAPAGCDSAFDTGGSEITTQQEALKAKRKGKARLKKGDKITLNSLSKKKAQPKEVVKYTQPTKVKLPCSQQIKCAQGTIPTDTDGDGCPDTCACAFQILCTPDKIAIDTTGNGCNDTCVCSLAVDCAPGYTGIDTSGNGCVDACKPSCKDIVCDKGLAAIDTNGDGCADTCQCATVSCAPGYTAHDADGDGCEESCIQVCGTIAGLTCGKGFFCQLPAGSCNTSDMAGICVPQPVICTKEYNPQCGCDGTTYGNPCMLAAAGAQLNHQGECCEPQDAQGVGMCKMLLGFYFTENGCESLGGCSCEGADCGNGYASLEACETANSSCKDSCEAQDAQGIGNCDMFFGFAFDGNSCEPVSGCECIGDDCDNLSPDPKGCGIQFADCLDSCEADDAQGVGMCDMFFGYAWDGNACVGISGCSCEGSDCDTLTFDKGACEKAHSKCETNAPSCGNK